MGFAANIMAAGCSAEVAKEIGGLSTLGATALGSTQATAYPITTPNTQFTTVAASTGAVLPSNLVAGDSGTISNAGANSLTVYPPLGGQLNGLAVNTGIAVAANKAVMFEAITGLLFHTIVST